MSYEYNLLVLVAVIKHVVKNLDERLLKLDQRVRNYLFLREVRNRYNSLQSYSSFYSIQFLLMSLFFYFFFSSSSSLLFCR